MTALGRGRDRTPDWAVQSVFDPDGEGHDFAYTIGLHDRGLPELHVWARPSLGDDPGLDWMFSPHDRVRLLDELAWRLVDGSLKVGDSWEQAYDEGLATVRFRLDPPGDRDELEALGIAPDASVVPVRWSLHRRPVRRPRPLRKGGLERARSEYAAILAELPDDTALPEGWSLPETFTEGGEFGPLTPMVAARVAELWSADPITLSNLMWAATSVQQGGFLTWPATVAAAVARDLGRVDEEARAQVAARDVVAARMARPDWPQTSVELRAAIGYEPGEVDAETFDHCAQHQLGDLLWSLLTTEVVADGLTTAQRLHGRGAWLTGLGPVGELPGPQWRAPRRVLDRLFALLRPLGVHELIVLVLRHENDDLADYQSLATRVQGWAFVAPAGCPWRGVLDRLPACRPMPRMSGLQEWATVMTSAACHRERLSAAEVAAICAPFLDLLPELPGLFAI